MLRAEEGQNLSSAPPLWPCILCVMLARLLQQLRHGRRRRQREMSRSGMWEGIDEWDLTQQKTEDRPNTQPERASTDPNRARTGAEIRAPQEEEATRSRQKYDLLPKTVVSGRREVKATPKV